MSYLFGVFSMFVIFYAGYLYALDDLSWLGAVILGSIAGILRHVADEAIRRKERELRRWWI